MASPNLSTLSSDHAASISTILNHLFSVFDAHSILATALTPTSITINYANGTPETYLLHSTREIPFSPPLLSLADAGARLDQMAAESRLRPKSGKSSITITEYRLPRGKNLKVALWGALKVVVWPTVRTIMGGNLYTDLLGLFRKKWACGIPAFFVIQTMCVQFGSTGLVLVPKLHKYNVPFGSVLWWKWCLGNVLGGMTSSWTFDEVVHEEEVRRGAEVKKAV
ncbi:uncharacterized protein BDZ99DRAFT_462136 [Mytilinidion resinicola]|uniref:DUF2470 domain-containing protein n=1 Tax=Mytilinidion resinicola TaxID=574789 RepID=A0A6A6YPK3_9PEZI|nr:uncharacterized protein BDZ99DRAFT_462136 [Mytilinidion resinicola]KAF2810826.1 hypothetical protein BDZ99DRAFT_462136 [Mytilinidion resinicola]